MRLTPKEKETLAIQKARNGKGIFAKNAFRVHSIVFEVSGMAVSGDADDDLDEETRNNMFRFDADTYISPKGTIADYLNHSCEPNAKVVKHKNTLLVKAISTIAKGSEVLIDYSTITARDDIWNMQCNCGTKTCRRVVKKFNSLPKELKNNYIQRSIVPKYILNI